jgi:hypothetical protein
LHRPAVALERNQFFEVCDALENGQVGDYWNDRLYAVSVLHGSFA